MRLAFIGIGNVGFALANGFQKKGHQIIIAHNDLKSKTVEEALKKNVDFGSAPIQEAINHADVVFLAIPFFASKDLLKPLDFQGKTLIDCTNPVGSGLSHGLESKMSGSEKIQELSKTANVVKAYTIYGFENLANPTFSNYNVKPVMLIAGDNEAAKHTVTKLNTDLGFETLDTGSLDQALHLEHMTLLWVKMVRRDRHHPNFTWAMLTR